MDATFPVSPVSPFLHMCNCTCLPVWLLVLQLATAGFVPTGSHWWHGSKLCFYSERHEQKLPSDLLAEHVLVASLQNRVSTSAYIQGRARHTRFCVYPLLMKYKYLSRKHIPPTPQPQCSRVDPYSLLWPAVRAPQALMRPNCCRFRYRECLV